jgi:hypothetical protein
MLAFLISTLLAVQPGPSSPAQPVVIRPGATPQGVSAVPISEVAEPLALAVAGFDGDHDGRTDRDEFDAALGRTVAAADSNGDGALGYIEYSGWAQTWLGSPTALPGPFAIDADGDNRLSTAEIAAEFGRQFVRLDADRDGAVTHSELLTIRNPRLTPVLDRNGRPIRSRERRERREER